MFQWFLFGSANIIAPITICLILSLKRDTKAHISIENLDSWFLIPVAITKSLLARDHWSLKLSAAHCFLMTWDNPAPKIDWEHSSYNVGYIYLAGNRKTSKTGGSNLSPFVKQERKSGCGKEYQESGKVDRFILSAFDKIILSRKKARVTHE